MDLWCSGVEVKALPGASNLTDDLATRAAEMATDALRSATGNQFGTVTEVVRPRGCGQSCDMGPPSDRRLIGWGLASVLGPWPLAGPYGGMAAACRGCGCWSTSAVELRGPVVWDTDHAIMVKVDGTALTYGTNWVRVDERNRGPLVVRTDGLVFPQCQNILLADTEAGTCSVTYTRGRPVTEFGHQAALALALQFARLNKWLTGDSCLPEMVRSITRQGVNVIGVDILELIRNGGTGITVVDMFVQNVNPNGLRRGARIYTPGLTDPLPRVRTAP